MNPDISYIGDSSCSLATVRADDTEALAAATKAMMHPESGVAGVRIGNFAKPQEIGAILDQTRRILLKKIDGMSLDHDVHALGITQQRSGGGEQYFKTADAWRRDAAFMNAVGPDSEIIGRTIRAFESAYGMEFRPAMEGGRPLLPAILRNFNYGSTHKDVVAAQEPWEIAALRNDIAWNVYLQMPRSGGELILYPPKTASLTKLRDIERFTPLSVRCNAGDLVFFRSEIPHGVSMTSEDDSRLAVSGRAAFEAPPSEKARYWA